MKTLPALLALVAAVPASGQTAPPPVRATMRPPVAAPVQRQRTILFIGNSFTQGASSAVRNWHAHRVTDLAGGGYGGVPALFEAFTEQVGQPYAVSLETQGGMGLGWHYDNRRHLFDRAWGAVVLQEYSTLDRERPGDPAAYIRDVGRLAALLRARDPATRIYLMATWSRADQTYQPGGHWYRRPIGAMAIDLRSAADRARATVPGIAGVLPVGQAWNRAFARGIADPDPYDGQTFGTIDLWAHDQYHASIHGYYLEALVVFGRVTGVDPRRLGPGERAADELGIAPATAQALQLIAYEQLAER